MNFLIGWRVGTCGRAILKRLVELPLIDVYEEALGADLGPVAVARQPDSQAT